MGMIYRGYPQYSQYPQAVAAAEQPSALQPYMIYRRQEQQPVMPEERRRFLMEQEYFKGLYPLSVRRWQRLAEEESDRHDYPGSPMYDEYPDREFLYQVRNAMLRQGAEWGQEADDRMRDLAFVLLLGEVSRRRAAKE